DNIAVRFEIFLSQAHKRGDEDGVAGLHVLCSAPIEVAVFLDKLEGIGSPVFAARFDHVQMADDQNRFQRGAAAAQSYHQIACSIRWTANKHVAFRKSGLGKALEHRPCGERSTSGGVRSVNLD